MNTFRFTTKTRCGKTDIIVQDADTLEGAKAKYMLHNAMKHTPMKLIKIEMLMRFNGSSTWTPVRGMI